MSTSTHTVSVHPKNKNIKRSSIKKATLFSCSCKRAHTHTHTEAHANTQPVIFFRVLEPDRCTRISPVSDLEVKIENGLGDRAILGFRILSRPCVIDNGYRNATGSECLKDVLAKLKQVNNSL